VYACGARALERGACPRVKQSVLADQRPVEVAGDGVDGTREVVREDQCFVIRNLTSAASWSGGRVAYVFGIRFV
jgi:hypothetical protein